MASRAFPQPTVCSRSKRPILRTQWLLRRLVCGRSRTHERSLRHSSVRVSVSPSPAPLTPSFFRRGLFAGPGRERKRETCKKLPRTNAQHARSAIYTKKTYTIVYIGTRVLARGYRGTLRPDLYYFSLDARPHLALARLLARSLARSRFTSPRPPPYRARITQKRINTRESTSMKKRREVALDDGGGGGGGDDDDDDEEGDGVVAHVGRSRRLSLSHIAPCEFLDHPCIHIRTRSTNIGAGITEEEGKTGEEGE